MKACRDSQNAQQIDRNNRNESQLTTLLDSLPKSSKGQRLISRTIGRGRDTGSWLSTYASSVNGTHLGKQEFVDSIWMRFAKDPKGLPDKCDGCGAKFDLEHSLHCKTGGLIHGQHNDLTCELMSLAAYAVGERNF